MKAAAMAATTPVTCILDFCLSLGLCRRPRMPWQNIVRGR